MTKNDFSWKLVINNLVMNAFKIKKIIIKSEGSQQRNFIHYNDVCKHLNYLINSESKKKLIYLTSKKNYTLIDLAFAIQNVYQKLFMKKLNIYINGNEMFKGKNKRVIHKSPYPIILKMI